jgi:DNA-binding NarL/FixJ family response regulator
MNTHTRRNIGVRLQALPGAESESLLKTHSIAIIDHRTLNRECFMRALEAQAHDVRAIGFCSIDEWESTSGRGEGLDAILHNVASADISSTGMRETLCRLVQAALPTPVILIAESDDLGMIIEAMACGARGCIPSSVSVDLLLEAIRLTASGGVFLPTTTLQALSAHVRPIAATVRAREIAPLLTSRQAEVAAALRMGKPNKVIAYELGMCENTVKVHVRTIMKKLNVSNRTEAAFKLNLT